MTWCTVSHHTRLWNVERRTLAGREDFTTKPVQSKRFGKPVELLGLGMEVSHWP